AERMDSTPLLSTFKFPVVIVHGEADALIPVARAREVKAAVPDSHYAELKDSGHVPMLEAAKETAEALQRLA
ncbi:MAG: alpha/beta hydrolase, partial [Anaerolineales bacterium]